MKQLALLFLMAAVSTSGAWAFDDTSFCGLLQPIVDKANHDAPTMVDAMTRLDGMALLCSLKTVDTKKFIGMPVTAMRDGWQGRKQAQWNAIFCKGDIWTQAIAAGWMIATTLTFVDGARVRLVAACQ